MNVPMSWINEYVQIDTSTDEFISAMTMSGSKVEAVECFGKEIQNIVVGRIMSIEKHPEADKLLLTKVDVGDKVLQIITGATNITEGALVPIALDGSTLADGKKIKKGKLRGIESEGMMCSIEELGYTTHDYPEAPEDGIYIFQKEQPLGADVVPILELNDEVVEYEITSNRPDCFSILGIAREAAATFRKPLKYPDVKLKETADGDASEMISVEIQNPELCNRYVARVVKNVKIEPSPQWMRHRLTMCGVRPINNIVDITNYVMLEYGQPMHAFDIDNISGRKIIVRNAEDGEIFTTLDGNERKLDASMLVIADKDKAVAIAGVMGGENSKVTGNASAILFESANFNGTNVRLTSKKLGLRTDSSGKFEKGLDPNLAMEAVNRAMQLVEELNCGEVVKGSVDCYPRPRNTWNVKYSPARINALLGIDITPEEMESYLSLLNIIAKDNSAEIPTFRPDLLLEEDLSEEIARLYGYDRIEPTLTGSKTIGRLNERQTLEALVRTVMISEGYCEALNYSFESPKVFDKLMMPENSTLRNYVRILNPIGEDYSVMRTSTINGMLASLSTNYNRRSEEAMLFEISKVYLPKSLPLTELPDEPNILTLGLYGKKDFYDVMGTVESLLETFGVNKAEYEREQSESHMHPLRTASVNVSGRKMGYLGQVHPAVCGNYGIETEVYIAVINLDILFGSSSTVKKFEPLPKYPSVSRDIAMLVRDDMFVREIEKVIEENGGKHLESVKLFDVYKGKQIQEGYKSVAYSISFRGNEKTLTDDEVSGAMKKILRGLENIGALLRDK